MSIDYQFGNHKFFTNKINLTKNTYQNFYPQKTFSNGIYPHKTKLKLKNTMSYNFSPLNKEKSKNNNLSTPSQSNPISNNNTWYNTNGFSPTSSKNIFSQVRTIKEKIVRKKIPKNKKHLLSMKYIGLKTDFNNINNCNYLKLTKESNIDNEKIIESNNNLHKKKLKKNFFTEDKNLLKDMKRKKIKIKANELINTIENKNNAYDTRNSLSFPNFKLTEEKENKNIPKNMKSQTVTKNYEIHNPFFDSKNNNKEKTKIDSFTETENRVITTFGNSKKNNDLLIRLKKKNKINKNNENKKNENDEKNENNVNKNNRNKNNENDVNKNNVNKKNEDKNIQNKNMKKNENNQKESKKKENMNNDNKNKKNETKNFVVKTFDNEELSQSDNIMKILKRKGYLLNSNIEMFDPLTFVQNKYLNKEYLMRKKKEKIYLKKLLKNNRIRELIGDINKYNEKSKEKPEKQNKSLKNNRISKINKTEPIIFTNNSDNSNYEKTLLKIIRHNYLNNNNYNYKFPNSRNSASKVYVKPSEYIKVIAKQIIENINFFKMKKYKQDSTDINEDNDELKYSTEENNNLIEVSPYKDEELFYDNVLLRNDLIKNYVKYKGNIAFYMKNKKIPPHKYNKTTRKNKPEETTIKKKAKILGNEDINLLLENKNILDSGIQDNEENITINKQYYTDNNSINNSINNSKHSEEKMISDSDESSDSFESNTSEKQDEKKIEKRSSNIFSSFKEKEKEKGKENNEFKPVEPKIRKRHSVVLGKMAIFDQSIISIPKTEDYNVKKNNIKDGKIDISKGNQIKNIYNNILSKGNKKIAKKQKKHAKNKNNLDKKKKAKIKIKKKNTIDDIELYDKLYGFNKNDQWDDLVIMEEFKKIDMNTELKQKLLDNRRHILIILDRKPKTREDYRQLNLCRNRVLYIIRKIIENIQKENLTSKPSKKKSLLPTKPEDRKKLYIYLRTIDLKIKNELEKNSKIDSLISFNSEKEEEEQDFDIDNINFFSLFPIKDEYYKRLIFEDEQRRKREKLIYDNSYLYHDENENKLIEIKKEVYDILYEPNEEIKEEEEEEDKNQNHEIRIDIHRRKKGKFLIRKKKGQKKQTFKYNLKKLENVEEEEVVKKEETESDDRKLERRLKNFYEQIQKLKAGKFDINDYDEKLGKLMMEQIDKDIYEEDKVKELRVFNFFKNFIACRKNESFGKNYLRKKFIYNSPVNFTFYPKMPKMKSVQLMNENV